MKRQKSKPKNSPLLAVAEKLRKMADDASAVKRNPLASQWTIGWDEGWAWGLREAADIVKAANRPGSGAGEEKAMKTRQTKSSRCLHPICSAGWKRINWKRLPKTGYIVAGSYRHGRWSTSSLSEGYGFPRWADEDRTHYFRLPSPPPNDKVSDGGPLTPNSKQARTRRSLH